MVVVCFKIMYKSTKDCLKKDVFWCKLKAMWVEVVL